ncbi:STAS domain-containing protein [Salimicrobium flavidum]|uniref:RsbT co-antagonist protein RsbR n=1 Tax=Salimicrobium flavidum TaxID=570947 RepID=A0A1N7J2Z4_9BACI|nr:STAS domain-containing protein [Salimicrobium flavidum]SIS43607.1 rsbT co-antagonist protein RsbR [Salimicrobium flavidum]
MKKYETAFPLPYFEVDEFWDIHGYSKEAEEIFGVPRNLREVVDYETSGKAKEWIRPTHEKAAVEVNVIKGNGDVILADVYVTWKNAQAAEVLLIPKDHHIDKVATRLKSMQTELTKTKSELVDEKERLENVTVQNNKLSAPFISLTEQAALVPLFGDLTHEKIMSVEETLLEDVRDSEADRILFDFTAVGSIEKEGFEFLASVMKALSHMGVDLTVIGLRPTHVPNIYKWSLPSNVQFMQSLEQVVANYLNEQKKLLEEEKEE